MRAPGDATALNIATVSGQARDLLSDFCNAIAGMRRELGFGGIGPRGMFFFYATVRSFAPRQILESGRMRGGSTLMLARCFPQSAPLRLPRLELPASATLATYLGSSMRSRLVECVA